MALEVGDLLDNKYRLVRILGSGGWGTVYEGENTRTLHRVAIKILHPEMIARRDMVARFEREAQAAGKIGSEHIIEVYDLGQLVSGEHYMVMEYLEGEDMAARLKALTRFEPEVLAPLIIQVLDGLGAAHAAGILHRDLKPANLFLLRTKSDQEFVKILDFGISKFIETPGTVTQTGAVMGSPCYMSPEQARGSKEIDHRSDLFSLGTVLFECVTGQLAFNADTFNELMFKIALEDAPDPRTVYPALDPDFAAIVRRALARDPGARYATAGEFKNALLAWLGERGHVSQQVVLRGSRQGPRTSTPSRTSIAQVRVEENVSELSSTLAEASGPDVSGSPAGLAVTAAGQRPGARLRPRALLIAAPLVVAVGVLVVLGFRRSSRVQATVAPPPLVVMTATASAEPDTAADAEAAAGQHAATEAAAADTPDAAVAPMETARAHRGEGTAVHATGRGVVAPRPTAAATPVVSPSAAPSASVAPDTHTIEGRRIHTGL